MSKKDQKLSSNVRTRVAPSPTGFPHVGTAFQALFDWVYARKHQGEFLLRIEDTDQKRYVAGAEQALFDAFNWLGLEPDEGPQKGGPKSPYRQSERLDLYQEYAQKLISMGHAYHCFCSRERLSQVRQQQINQGKPPMYDGKCLSLSEEEVKKRLNSGEESVIRMKVPNNEVIEVEDALRGIVEFDSNVVDDQVLIKSDGFPTYHLAVVVDDHFMEISHTVRGEEWLPSAPKHILLYGYFGWEPPVLIHTPNLRNADKSKLSKRKGNTSLWWYREHGYLKDALLNFLGLIGWRELKGQEIFSLKEMIEEFQWQEMKVTGPVFDVKKLHWMNGKYIRELTVNQFAEQLRLWALWVIENGKDEKIISQAEKIIDWHDGSLSLFKGAINLAQDRAKTLAEVYDLIEFFFLTDLEYDLRDLLQGHSAEAMINLFKTLDKRFSHLKKLNAKIWEETVRQTADEFEMKHKDAFMAMRSALTAQKFTPPLFDIMILLGQAESSRRFKQAIAYLKT